MAPEDVDATVRTEDSTLMTVPADVARTYAQATIDDGSRWPDAAVQAVADALEHVPDGTCGACWRPAATPEQWDTVPEGGRPDLCWDEAGACRWDDGNSSRRQAKHLLAALRQQSTQMTGMTPLTQIAQRLEQLVPGPDQVRHLYRGMCPDDLSLPSDRDPGCPACALLPAPGERTTPARD